MTAKHLEQLQSRAKHLSGKIAVYEHIRAPESQLEPIRKDLREVTWELEKYKSVSQAIKEVREELYGEKPKPPIRIPKLPALPQRKADTREYTMPEYLRRFPP